MPSGYVRPRVGWGGHHGGVVQSVELLLDRARDAAVRARWDRLRGAGLPSQARHTGASNAPHVTLAAREAIDPGAEPGLRATVAGLPMPLRLGALACFGRGRFVLVRLVVPGAQLLALHAAVAHVLGPDPHGLRNLAPGEWTPHVTLARRLTGEQVARALGELDGAGEQTGAAVGYRRWDGATRTEWSLLT